MASAEEDVQYNEEKGHDQSTMATRVLRVDGNGAPRPKELLAILQKGISDSTYTDLDFESIPQRTLDDRDVRHAVNDIVSSRVWRSITLSSCDDHDFEYLVERCLATDRVRNMHVSLHSGYGFSSEALGRALKVGLTHTKSLTTLHLSGILMTNHSASLIGQGIAYCESLDLLQIDCAISYGDVAVRAIAEGIRRNRTIRKLNLIACDEWIGTILSAIGGSSNPVQKLTIGIELEETQTNIVKAIAAWIQETTIRPSVCLYDLGPSEEGHSTDLLPIIERLEAGICLDTLQVTFGRISDASWMALWNVLHRPCLQRLCIQSTHVPEAAMQSMTESIAKFRLKELAISNAWGQNSTFISGSGLTAAVAENFDIEELWLDSNSAPSGPVAEYEKKLHHYCRLNKAGRRLFNCPDSVYPGIWPIVLERVNVLDFGRMVDANTSASSTSSPESQELRRKLVIRAAQADVLFAFLQGLMTDVLGYSKKKRKSP